MPAAPTVTTGVRITGANIQQARRVVEMLDKIYDYDPNSTPFLTILSKRAPGMVAGNPKYQHLEDQPLPVWSTLNGSITNVATTINVAAGTGVYFRTGDLFVLPSSTGFALPGEVGKVVTVATDALTVVRNYDGDQVTGGATSSGANIQIIGNVNAENASIRTVKTTTEAVQTNYTQIIRTPFNASNTLQASTLYGGKERTRQRAKFATQHAFEIERAFLFGKQKETLSTGERSTGGILQTIATNTTNANGTLTAATVEAFCQSIFRYGSGSKLFMCSRRIASQLDLIGEGKLETMPAAETYGVAIKRYVTAHGELLVNIHDLFINDYAGLGIAVDMEYVKKRYLADDHGARDGRLRTDIQAPDVDGWADEYLSEVGLHVQLESAHGYLYGVT
jgi:hypothetical protein